MFKKNIQILVYGFIFLAGMILIAAPAAKSQNEYHVYPIVGTWTTHYGNTGLETFVFTADGHFTDTYSGKTLSGTYTYNAGGGLWLSAVEFFGSKDYPLNWIDSNHFKMPYTFSTVLVTRVGGEPQPEKRKNPSIVIDHIDFVSPDILRVFCSKKDVTTDHKDILYIQVGEKNFDYTIKQPITENSVVEIPLHEHGVPRFSEATTLTVVSEDLKSLGMTVPLPILFVEGIKATIPEALSTSIQDLEKSLQKATANMGTNLQFSPTGELKYKTLFPVKYDNDKASFEDGSTAISQCWDNAMKETYASRCLLVAHSRGCLMARQLMESKKYDKNPFIKRVWFVQAPNLGSLWATTGQSFFLSKVNYQNIFPSWDWYKSPKDLSYTIPKSYSNNDLDDLNSKALSSKSDYVIVFSRSHNTPYRFTGDINTFKLIPTLAGMPSSDIENCQGDEIVPLFSQLGVMTWKTPSTSINSFIDMKGNVLEISESHLDWYKSNILLADIISNG